MLSQKELKSVVEYCPLSGVFTYVTRTSNRINIGDKAGSIDRHGYEQLCINYKKYASHRMAFLYINGALPSGYVDHINGVRCDNRWKNLRDVTCEQNQKNQKLKSGSKSGVIGVAWCNDRSNWRAYIGSGGIAKNLGRFDDFFEACCARKSAERGFGFHVNHGRK